MLWQSSKARPDSLGAPDYLAAASISPGERVFKPAEMLQYTNEKPWWRGIHNNCETAASSPSPIALAIASSST